MWDALDKQLLKEIADLHDIPAGAFNIRKDGKGIERSSGDGVEITPKRGKPGINVVVKPGTKQTVHIPVIITRSGLIDEVHNTIEIGAGADIYLVAGCGIHNPGDEPSRHDGIHEIFVRQGARLHYVEKHYGEGGGKGKRILNPKTVLLVEKDAYAELELLQIRGVDDTVRITGARVEENGGVNMFERLLTSGKQSALSEVEIALMGDDSTARIVSRSVAQESSQQIFKFRLIAHRRGRGHVECDSIIMDRAVVRSIPEIWAENSEAELIHEAAIGKIAGEQLLKLMALGLTKTEAEEAIISGFLSREGGENNVK